MLPDQSIQMFGYVTFYHVLTIKRTQKLKIYDIG